MLQQALLKATIEAKRKLKVDAIAKIKEMELVLTNKNEVIKGLQEKVDKFESAVTIKIKENEGW